MHRALSIAMVMFVAGCANTEASNTDGGVGLDGRADAARDQGPTDQPLPKPGLVGKVLAPEGTIPISGALVYAVSPSSPPAPIPQTVYCDTCVEIPASTPHAFSGADGRFELQLPYPGKWLLVTQKGAFRRIRELDVKGAGMVVPTPLTMLPHQTDAAAGDNIPRMLVLGGAWDAIESSLAKLGLGLVDAKGLLVRGTEEFSLVECKLISIFPPQVDCQPKDPATILSSYDELANYQIIFLPCDNGGLDSTFSSPTGKAALLKWISAGGRLYATDYTYDVMTQLFPGYIEWEGQSGTMGSAELSSAYDAPAIVNDADLSAWLAGQGIGNFTLLESWTVIKALKQAPTPAPDDPAKTYLQTPKAWISGQVPSYGIRPMTVSFAYGCGRALFSAYHTEGSKSTGKTLLPQELALIYIVLETAVCIEPPKID